MTILGSTRFLGLCPGGVQSPHVGECLRESARRSRTGVLDMNKQRDGGRVSAAGDR